jgi:hypothetical protein
MRGVETWHACFYGQQRNFQTKGNGGNIEEHRTLRVLDFAFGSNDDAKLCLVTRTNGKGGEGEGGGGWRGGGGCFGSFTITAVMG